MRYSTLNLLKEGLRGHRHWPPAWASASPKRSYDVIIIGGGGHGLATAYYLVKNHGISNIAVLERGWLGGGNMGRNTTIVRSNYFFPESAAFYDFSLKLYEGLSAELNYNIMLSQRGVMNLAHTGHDEEMMNRSCNAMLLNDVDAAILTPEQVQQRVPALDMSPTARYPVRGALVQERAGSARHDAVAWGYARQASRLGVDIIQNCEVTGFDIQNGCIAGVQTSLGPIAAHKVGIAVAGHSSVVAAMAGFRLPIRSFALQAYVSEPMKPILDTVVLSPATGVYLSQSDKGELVIGAGLDLYTSYAQRGNLPVLEDGVAGMMAMFPQFSRVRLLRQWAGIVDIVHDSTPIIDKTPVDGLYFNGGWGTGGFKAVPAGGYTFAHTILHDEQHPLVKPFGFDRFEAGALINEAAAAGIAH
ncbi:MAG: sarcosine oxidase subunit beta family protein [Pseudomonadota bacterium]